MARIIYRRKKQLTTEVKRERKAKYSVYGIGKWIDPYPYVQGTLPEKMVYAYLMQIGIPFYFSTYTRIAIPEISLDKWYRPDFIIPSLKIIIEVQGAYWHSKPDQIEEDARKQAYYTYTGWTVLAWWDYDIFSLGVYQLAQQEPKLMQYSGPKVGEVITKDKKVIDDSAGIRTANAQRASRNYKGPLRTKIDRKSKKGVLSYGIK